MPKLRVRIKLNEGGEGAPLDQLADVGVEVERFLRLLSHDAGIPIPKGKWLARDFRNESVSFDTEGPVDYIPESVRNFNSALAFVSDYDPDKHVLNGGVQQKTILQYAKIVDALEPHEKISFGIYRVGEEAIHEWKPLTKRRASTLKERMTQSMTYVGSLSGKLHNIIIEPTLSFNLRDSKSNELVRCDANDDLYEQLHTAMKRRHALIYVRGAVTVRRVDKAVTAVKAIEIKSAPELNEKEYQSFFGLSPNYTGGLSTEDYVGEARRYGQ